MEVEAWLALATVHLLGAASPGPSLAVVLRNTLTGGARLGVITGVGHGIGFGIYALLVASGLATALSANRAIEQWLQWGERRSCCIWAINSSATRGLDPTISTQRAPSLTATKSRCAAPLCRAFWLPF